MLDNIKKKKFADYTLEFSSLKSAINLAKVVFWDFDGVIKDSVEVKTMAYESLFSFYGHKIAKKVRRHHEVNGGVSRYEKIPLYLEWSGESVSPELVNDYCNRYSKLVVQGVLDSDWVPGARDYLAQHFSEQYFVLVTATPQDEIQQILTVLNVNFFFREVYGAPRKKEVVIKEVLNRLQCAPESALMIGDSETDLHASQTNFVPFILRRTPFNLAIQSSYKGLIIKDLTHE